MKLRLTAREQMLVAGLRRELTAAAREGKGKATTAELTAAMVETWGMPEATARRLVRALVAREPNLLT